MNAFLRLMFFRTAAPNGTFHTLFEFDVAEAPLGAAVLKNGRVGQTLPFFDTAAPTGMLSAQPRYHHEKTRFQKSVR